MKYFFFFFFPLRKGLMSPFLLFLPPHLSVRRVWSCCRELFSLLCPSFCSPCFSFPPSCPSLLCPSSPSFLVLLDDSHPSCPPERQHFNTAAAACSHPTKTRGNQGNVTLGGIEEHFDNTRCRKIKLWVAFKSI